MISKDLLVKWNDNMPQAPQLAHFLPQTCNQSFLQEAHVKGALGMRCGLLLDWSVIVSSPFQ